MGRRKFSRRGAAHRAGRFPALPLLPQRMSQLHAALLSTLLSRKVLAVVNDVRGLAEIIEEEPDLSEHERAALLRATRRMLAEADTLLGWISQVPMSGVRN